MFRFLLRLATLSFLPRKWRIPCFAAFGVFAGLGLTTVHVSRAASYMTDDPEACVNCHVMTVQYATWQRSSHANVATCNDCHVPHTNVLEKYAFKARDGAYHSTIFTLRLEPQAITMSSAAIPVVEANCRRCHAELVSEVHLRQWQEGDNRCWDCHREVPHGRMRSLSAVPRVMTPQLPEIMDALGKPTIGGRLPRPEQEGTPHE